ncbi:hypothetical protein HOI18_05265 [Candidatus Uhrbacteria bacterium]|jgi:hypothetical protein|nr:hypothetical protein [Candidatus Uhrbacteria bacterium]
MSKIEAVQLFKLMELLGSRGGPSAEELEAFMNRPKGPIMPSGSGAHVVLECERLQDDFGIQEDGNPIEALKGSAIRQLMVDPKGNPAFLTVAGVGEGVVHRGLWHDVSSVVGPEYYASAFGFKIVGFKRVSDKFLPVTTTPLKRWHEDEKPARDIAVFVGSERQDEPEGLVGYHPLRDGSVIRVVRLRPHSPLAVRWYSLTQDNGDVGYQSIRRCPRSLAKDQYGALWMLDDCWAAPIRVDRTASFNPEEDPYVIDLIDRRNGLELVVGTSSSELMGARLMRPDGDTYRDLTPLSQRRATLPYIRGMKIIDTDALAYVAKLGDGQETWVIQRHSDNSPDTQVGPSWDHVSELFYRWLDGRKTNQVCYYAAAGRYLYLVEIKDPLIRINLR